jgi:hypothetical protein
MSSAIELAQTMCTQRLGTTKKVTIRYILVTCALIISGYILLSNGLNNPLLVR